MTSQLLYPKPARHQFICSFCRESNQGRCKLLRRNCCNDVFSQKFVRTLSPAMGVDHWRDTGDKSPPEFGVGGTLVQIVPLRFLSYRYKKKRSVAFRIRQNPFSAGALPRTPLGELTTLPRPHSLLERGHPSPYPTPFGTDPTSALAMRPPQNSSQIYAYESGDHFVFQQDGAPSHRVKSTVEFLQRTVPNFIESSVLCPPTARTWTRLTTLYGALQQSMCRIPISNLDDLKDRVRTCWENLDQQIIDKSITHGVTDWRLWFEYMVDTIEQLCSVCVFSECSLGLYMSSAVRLSSVCLSSAVLGKLHLNSNPLQLQVT